MGDLTIQAVPLRHTSSAVRACLARQTCAILVIQDRLISTFFRYCPRSLYLSGAIGAACSASAPLTFLLVGRAPCTFCVVAQASVPDVAYLALGSVLFASGFILSSACVSPVLVQSATSKSIGKVTGLGATASAVGRALGPATWGLLMKFGNASIALVIASAVASTVCVAWFIARHIDRTEDDSRYRGRGDDQFYVVVKEALAARKEQKHQDGVDALKMVGRRLRHPASHL